MYIVNEIKYILDIDLIEPTVYGWNAPCILIPKPDGSYRMCMDYRKINSVTKPDTYLI